MTSTAPSSPARKRTDARRVATLAGLALLGLLLCATAAAKKSDRSKDVQVEGTSLDAQLQPNGVSHIRNAIITQGTLKITGHLATIHLDAQTSVKRAVVTGKAHIQQLDDNGNRMTGDADSIDYDVQTGIATFTGNAFINQIGRGSMRGDKLVYNTTTSAVVGQSGGDKRVHLIFKAKPKPKSAPKPASKPATAASAATPAAPASTAGN